MCVCLQVGSARQVEAIKFVVVSFGNSVAEMGGQVTASQTLRIKI
jgi:hypothetical protein